MNRAAAITSAFLLLAPSLSLFVQAEKEKGSEQSAAAEPKRQVWVLNAKPETVDLASLKKASAKIVKLWAEGKLVPARVQIFAEHNITKEALADKTIEIITGEVGLTVILVPIPQRGGRVIVKTLGRPRDTYSLFSLPEDAGVDLQACLKK